MPDFTKLRTLHDWIMDNVPPERFNLSYIWVDDNGGSGCALGWAPEAFREDVLCRVYWVSEAQQLFALTEGEAIGLFRARRGILEPRQHKQAWHERVQRFFAEQGEPLKLPLRAPSYYFNTCEFFKQYERDRERERELVD